MSIRSERHQQDSGHLLTTLSRSEGSGDVRARLERARSRRTAPAPARRPRLADTGDTTAARAAFNDAYSTYAALGASWDLARSQARFRGYGIRRGPIAKHRRVDHGWDSLTPTEKKIVMLVADGMSNPQIAAQLFLSRRTVQGHVSHILSKLDVHSRLDIAREATRRESITTA